MKILTFFLSLLFSVICQAQHSLTQIWESDTSLAIPESVFCDNDILYVSLVEGQAWDIDGKGGIAKLDKNGNIIDASWITGLNAPKGMGIWNKKLFVADVSEVVVINTLTGKIESKIPVKGAIGLNDITVDRKGTIYVSDSRLGNVYQIKNGKTEPYLSDLKGANGLKAIDNNPYILTDSDVFKATPDKKLVSIAKMKIGGDGIEPIGNGDYIVSC
jgi:sugar lactone lactonase YvrE